MRSRHRRHQTDFTKPLGGLCDLAGFPKTTDAEWEELRKALQRLANKADRVSPLAVDRRMAGAALELLKDGEHGLDGHVFVFYQWSKKGDQHLSRSCAVRVDDVVEIRGIFKEFFKLGSVHVRSFRGVV